MKKINSLLTKDDIDHLMCLIEEKYKNQYKTQEEWQESEHFALIEKLDDLLLADKIVIHIYNKVL